MGPEWVNAAFLPILNRPVILFEFFNGCSIIHRDFFCAHAPVPVNSMGNNMQEIDSLKEEIKALKGKLEELESLKSAGARAEEALRESEDLYRTLAESADDCIFIIGTDLRIEYLNNFAARFLGREKGDIIGRPLSDFFPPPAYSLMKKSIQEVFTTGVQLFKEDIFDIPGKGAIGLGTKLSPLFGKDGAVRAVLGIARDITARLQCTGELKKERDRAQMYLDVAGAILLIIDASQTVRLINRRGAGVLGLSEETVVGKNWFDNFVPEEMRAGMKECFSMVFSGGEGTYNCLEGPVLTRDGGTKVISWTHTLLRDDEGVACAVLTSGVDITERKKSEEENQRLIAELKEALSNIKILRGLIPICASCKKIRDDNGYWKKLEVYIQEHSEADFSHGICPDCARRFY